MRFVAIVALAAGSAGVQEAARAELEASRIGLEETVNLSVSVPGERDGPPELPRMPGLEVRGESRGSSISFSGGSLDRETRWTYVLQPTRTGDLAIPAIPVPGYAPTEPLTLRVEPGRVRAPSRPRSVDPFASPLDSLFGRPDRAPALDLDDLFVRVEADRRDVRVGEQVLVLYRLYARVPVLFAQETGGARPEGVWIEDVTLPDVPWLERGLSPDDVAARRALPGPVRERRVVDGVEYDTWPILMRAVFPAGAGERVLPGPTFEIGVRTRSRSLFSPEQVVHARTAPAVALRVEELPETGRPPDFGGTVGEFALSGELLRNGEPLDGRDAAVGETLVLRVRLEGEGNLSGVDPPALDPTLDGDFRVFDPDNEQAAGLRADGDRFVFGGVRSWSFPVVAERGGAREIGPATLHAFNPGLGAYERLATDPIPIRVTGGSADIGAPAAAASPGARFGDDIRYLKPVGPAAPARDWTGLFWVALALPPAWNLAVLALARRRRDRALHADAYRRARAAGAATRRLRRLRPDLDPAETGGAVAEILYRYAADRLGGSPAGLTPDAAAARFREVGAADSADRLGRTLSEAEGARYRGDAAKAPGASEARELIASLEAELTR